MTAPAGLLERISSRLFPAQAGLEGLLTEEDYQNAQRQGMLSLGAGLLAQSGPSTMPIGFGQAVGRALQGAQEGYQGSLDSLANRRAAGQEFRRGAAGDARRADLEAARARIIAENPMPPESDPNRMVTWIDKVFPAFVRSGDDEMISRLTQIRSSIGSSLSRNSVPQKIEEVVGPDGKPAFGYITPEGVKIIPGAGPVQKQGSLARPRMVTLVNPQTGKPEIALMDPNTGDFNFTGQVPGGRAEMVTEGERKGAVLLQMALVPARMLDEATAPSRVEQLAGRGGLNEFLSSRREIINQWGFLVADSYVRLTSGANAPEPEVQRAFRAITPAPGDSPELLAEKRRTRARFVKALRVAAGRAGQQIEDEAETEVTERPPLSSFNFGGTR